MKTEQEWKEEFKIFLLNSEQLDVAWKLYSSGQYEECTEYITVKLREQLLN